VRSHYFGGSNCYIRNNQTQASGFRHLFILMSSAVTLVRRYIFKQ